jgi:hypothetical protein
MMATDMCSHTTTSNDARCVLVAPAFTGLHLPLHPPPPKPLAASPQKQRQVVNIQLSSCNHYDIKHPTTKNLIILAGGHRAPEVSFRFNYDFYVAFDMCCLVLDRIRSLSFTNKVCSHETNMYGSRFVIHDLQK